MGYRISKILVVLIILCTLVASAFTCFAFCYFNFPIFSTLIIPLVFLLTMFFPSVGISALLILLPVFGNKPGSTQATYLIVVQSAIILALGLRYRFQNLESFLSTKILFFSFLYSSVSILSLSSILNTHILSDFSASWNILGMEAISANIIRLINLQEDKIYYSLSTVFFTLLCFVQSYYIYLLIAERKSLAYRFSWSILSGLFASFLFGLLDYYRLINLRWLRALDPTVNPGDAQFRLQSFFGHSGWYAEYLTLCIPFVILFLLTKLPNKIKILILLLIMILGEFVLVLTFQRGGWVSYPLTLCVIWAAVYSLKGLEQGIGFKNTIVKSFKKIILSIPLTVLLTLLLINYLNSSGKLSPERSESINSYVDRFKDISKTSDRSDFMYAGWLIAKLNPIFGAGSESFCVQYDKEFINPEGRYYQLLNLPLHGTAHNVYFQTLSGKGVFGLGLLLLIVFALAEPGLRLITGKIQSSRNDLILILASFCFAISFLIYGMVQEMFYINSLQVLFFSVIAINAGISQNILKQKFQFFFQSIFIIFIALLLHLAWGKYNLPKKNLQEAGCFSWEVTAEGKEFKWCGPKARILIPLIVENGEKFANVKIGLDFIKENLSSAKLLIKSEDQVLLQENLAALSSKDLKVKLPDSFSGDQVLLDLQLNSAFIPARVFKSGNDFRVLSFKVYN